MQKPRFPDEHLAQFLTVLRASTRHRFPGASSGSQLLQRKASPSFSFCGWLPGSSRGSYLGVGRVEVHVVDPATGWVHPAGAQAILQRLEGDVQADHQVQLADPIQSLGLSQRPRETWAGSRTEIGMRGWKAARMEPNSSVRQLQSCSPSPTAAQVV